MPTMSKLIAAACFAAVAYFAAIAYRPTMPEGTQFGFFNMLCAVIGLICGWRVMGPLTGKGYRQSAGSGIRTSVTFFVCALLTCSVILMVREAFKKRYDSPMEAIVDIFALSMENGIRIFDVQKPEVLGVLLIGGAVGGDFG